MTTEAALQELGLTPVESTIYLYLLRNSTSTGPQLQTALAMQKVPVYRALSTLKAKGFVTSLGETRNQRFSAQPLIKLLGRYDQRMQELTEARAGLETFMRTVAEQQHELYKQNKIQIFEGKQGYRLWNEERLRDDVLIIREGGIDSFVNEFFSPQEIKAYMEDYIARRVSKGISIRILHNSDEPLMHYDQSNPKIFKETRATKMPSDLHAYMSIFGTRFGFYTRQEGRYLGVIVDDPMMASMMGWLFDSLWANSRQI